MASNGLKMLFAIVGMTAVVLASSCAEAPEHPHNALAGDQICGPLCNKERECNPNFDQTSCMTRCKNKLSPRTIYWNDKIISDVADCSNKQACVPNTTEPIVACARDAQARFPASAAVRTFCEKAIEKDRLCGMGTNDLDHCIWGTKIYTDAILGQLTDCLDDPCRHYSRCTIAVLGDDAVASDKDRQAAFKASPVPQARTSVTVSGKIDVYGDNKTTVAGAKLCVHDDAKTPCAVSDDNGKFSLEVPAARDLAIEVVAPAPEFAPIVFGFSAHVADAPNYSIGVPRTAALVKRYGGFGVTYPDAATGFIRASAMVAKDLATNLDALTATLDPKSGGGPFLIAAASPPPADQKDVFHNVAFSNVAPGTVEISFGPSSLDCTPAFGAWSTGKPNTVRVPVIAGFETEVLQRCK